jgi:hypothetical protein
MMKAHISYDVPASREAVGQILGPRLGKLYVPNPATSEYRAVLLFSISKVVTRGDLLRALSRARAGSGAVLAAGRDFTMEARDVAAERSCDIVAEGEFGWTDAAYSAIRQRKV